MAARYAMAMGGTLVTDAGPMEPLIAHGAQEWVTSEHPNRGAWRDRGRCQGRRRLSTRALTGLTREPQADSARRDRRIMRSRSRQTIFRRRCPAPAFLLPSVAPVALLFRAAGVCCMSGECFCPSRTAQRPEATRASGHHARFVQKSLKLAAAAPVLASMAGFLLEPAIESSH